jgi:hypothetical protein
VRSKKVRITSLFVVPAAVVAFIGFVVPGASAAPGDIHVDIVQQPTDTSVSALITGDPFDPTGAGDNGFVQVKVTEEAFEGPPIAVADTPVTFELAVGSGLATSDSFNVQTRYTNVDGIATFEPFCEGSECDDPLSIGDANQPFTTAYKLIPVATLDSETTVSGDPSAGFDIWGAGCKGNGCNVNLTPGTSSDTYTTSENVGMGASLLGLGGTNIVCPTQQLIFSTNLFFHATTNNGPNPGPVFLVSHISAADRKAVANNGNKVMGWCVGLKSKGPWNFVRQNTNGDAVTDPNNGTWVPGSDLWVGMAAKCPSKNASTKAPCIVSQTGDGVGGTFIRGWLPGGDPPRRT